MIYLKPDEKNAEKANRKNTGEKKNATAHTHRRNDDEERRE